MLYTKKEGQQINMYIADFFACGHVLMSIIVLANRLPMKLM